jgi:MFS family permease
MAGPDVDPGLEPFLGNVDLPSSAAESSSALSRLLTSRAPAVLEPLRIRDFRLFWAGQSVSLVGDGVYMVAIAWQVYALSNVPTALAVVGIAQTVPLVAFVLVGGALADRLDRRRLMIVGAAIPGLAIGVLAGLTFAGVLALWQVWVISAAVGLGRAFWGPASGAFVPDIVPAGQLVQANSLAQVVRPLATTLIGPAIGGVLVALVGASICFAIDAASFGAAVAALLAIPSRPVARRGERTAILVDIREGFRYIRRHTWIWGTLAMATVWVLLLLGPLDVLVPYIVKNDLGGSASALGLIYACGGIGAIAAALITGQRGLPARPITRMLLGWGLGCATITGIALATSAWQAALAFLAFQALLTYAEIIWITLLQRYVPTYLLGRVRSLDWLLSVGLVPISFALTAPVANALGPRTTLAASSLIAATVAIATLLLPGLRQAQDGKL